MNLPKTEALESSMLYSTLLAQATSQSAERRLFSKSVRLEKTVSFLLMYVDGIFSISLIVEKSDNFWKVTWGTTPGAVGQMNSNYD